MNSETAQARHLIPTLSVVAVTRNDDHGVNMRGRMQHFVAGFIAQCRRHQLDAELILVEWNPPAARPPLEDILEWPDDFGPAQVRIIRVPADVHAKFANSESLQLFQMIGKNVGIRGLIHIFLDDHDLLPALGQVSSADHTVVAGADDDAIVF